MSDVPVDIGAKTRELNAPGPPLNVPGTSLWAVAFPLLAIAAGVWVYRDARNRGRKEWAPFLGLIVGGLFLTGSLPGLAALVVADAPATQGFPTALRVIPGFAALAVYVYFR